MFAKLRSVLSTASRDSNTVVANDAAALDEPAVNETWIGVNAPASKEGTRRATVTNSDVLSKQPVKFRTADPGNAPRAQISRRDGTVIIEGRLFTRKCNSDDGASQLAKKFRAALAVIATRGSSGQTQQKVASVSMRPSVVAVVKATPHPTSGAREFNGSLPRLEMSPEDRLQLRAHIGNIKQALAAKNDGEFRDLTSNFARVDYHFMPRLIESANLSKPGLDLEYADTVFAGAELLKKVVEAGVSSGRYIVNFNSSRQIHFCAVDYRLIEGIPSVIAFEAVRPRMLSDILEDELHWAPKTRFLTVGMDIQRSGDDCGMFSLAFAKKLYKEQAWMKSLHVRNAAGELLLMKGGQTTPTETDRIVPPPSLYKHSQTRKRLAEYLDCNPDRRNVVVNKKKETLLKFQQRHRRILSAGFSKGKRLPDAVMNFSIHEKRLREYELLEARTMEARPESHPDTGDAGDTIA